MSAEGGESDSGYAAQLAALKARSDARFGAHYAGFAARLTASGLLAERPRPGDPAPDFMLPNAAGRLVTRDALLARGPVLVVAFIRGAWCPFCQLQTAMFQAALCAYRAAGVTLALLTPEAHGAAAAMKRAMGLDFELLCDVDQGVALAYGCLVPAPEDFRDDLRAIGIDLAVLYDSAGAFLPLPAAFAIGPDGTVLRVFGGVDHRDRPHPLEILRGAIAAQAASA